MKATSIFGIGLALIALAALFFYENNATVYATSGLTSAEFRIVAQKALDEAYQEGNLDALDRIFAADIVIHGFAPQDIGLDGFKQASVVASRAVYSDLRMVVDSVLIEGDMVASQLTFRGIYKGPGKMRWTFRDKNTGVSQTVDTQPRSGVEHMQKACIIARMVDGKMTEMQVYMDSLGSRMANSGMIITIESVRD